MLKVGCSAALLLCCSVPALAQAKDVHAVLAALQQPYCDIRKCKKISAACGTFGPQYSGIHAPTVFYVGWFRSPSVFFQTTKRLRMLFKLIEWCETMGAGTRHACVATIHMRTCSGSETTTLI